MKRRRDYWHQDIDRKEKIAGFGDAVITRDLRGRFALRGGTDAERKEAHDWMLRFLWPSDQPTPNRWPGIQL
jgi:hypothetical protein